SLQSTPPQNDTGPITSAVPAPSPRWSARPRATSAPDTVIAPHLPLYRRADALLEAAERHRDADVPGRVVGPLDARGHPEAAHLAHERRDVRARVGDERDARVAERLRLAALVQRRQRVAPGVDVHRDADAVVAERRGDPRHLVLRGVGRADAHGLERRAGTRRA